jgi:hypothetical protein
MRKFFKTLLCTAAVATLAMIGSANAALLGSGSVSVAGGWTPSGGTGTVGTATGVHFIPATNNVSVQAPGGTGSFSSLTTGTVGTVHDFTFNPSSAPQAGFLVLGGFTFDLTSTSIVLQNSTDLVLHGTTTISSSAGTGSGSFDFSGQGGGQPATFSWSATATSVPEPMTLGVLGIGLAGFGALRRRAQKA